MSRKAFVAVIAAQSLLTSGRAAANPPAPSAVPDPVLSPPHQGETAHRIKRHESGCFLHFESGGVAKTECPSVMDKSGEVLEREPESGQCVLIEPWAEEPKEAPCPTVLVPPGWKGATVKELPASSAKPATLAPPEPVTRAGCSGCTTGRTSSTPTLAIVVLAAAPLLRRRKK